MILPDTNVVIPLLIEHENRTKSLRLFHLDSNWHLPDWWRIEIANVLRNYHRAKLFTFDELTTIQRNTSELFPPENTHPVDLMETLRIACAENISVYDARFIALARRFGIGLVTEDARLRKACPADTLSLDESLALFPPEP